MTGPLAGTCGVCPSCGEPRIGGPGCTAGVCAWTCGDPDHGQGDCTEACWSPLGLTTTNPPEDTMTDRARLQAAARLKAQTTDPGVWDELAAENAALAPARARANRALFGDWTDPPAEGHRLAACVTCGNITPEELKWIGDDALCRSLSDCKERMKRRRWPDDRRR